MYMTDYKKPIMHGGDSRVFPNMYLPLATMLGPLDVELDACLQVFKFQGNMRRRSNNSNVLRNENKNIA